MNSKVNKIGKSGVTFIISIILVIVGVLYWIDFNAVKSVCEIKKDVTSLVDTSLKEGTFSTNEKLIPAITVAVNRNKYIKPGFKTSYHQFINVWTSKDSKAMTPAELKGIRTSLRELSQTEEEKKYLEYNQGIALLIIVTIFVLFLVAARHHYLLRDIVGNWNNINRQNVARDSLGLANNNANTLTDVAKPPYSLARTQVSVWTIIIGSLYIYALLWDERLISGINQTALILMGISAATVTTAAFMDVTEVQQGVQRSQDNPSEGFFNDILSDKNGISIQRYQNVIWTVIAMIIYIYRYTNPISLTELPVLDGTILALSGISNATYLIFKARENLVPSREMKINLVPGDNFTEEERKFIANSNNGFKDAKVVVMFLNDENKIEAKPESNFEFVAKGIDTEKHKKITAEWKGKLKSDGSDVTLTCTNSDVAFKEAEVITIKLDKPQ